MAELKTQRTNASVSQFINAIDDERRRKDCKAKEQHQWFQCGVSPRKQALTLYLMGGYPKDSETAKKLGKFKTGGSCLYIKTLDDVHVPTLRSLIAQSLKRVKAKRIEYSK